MQKRQNDDQDFVRFEIEKAIEREVPIVPLSLGQTTFPSAADLPSSISELAYQNGMQIRDEPGFRSDMKELIDALMKFGLTSTKKAARRKSAKG
jgi:hypothetical protein